MLRRPRAPSPPDAHRALARPGNPPRACSPEIGNREAEPEARTNRWAPLRLLRVDELLGRDLAVRRRRWATGGARGRHLDHRRLPVLRDVLHLLVDEQTIGVPLAVRRADLERAGDLDLVTDGVRRA